MPLVTPRPCVDAENDPVLLAGEAPPAFQWLVEFLGMGVRVRSEFCFDLFLQVVLGVLGESLDAGEPVIGEFCLVHLLRSESLFE